MDRPRWDLSAWRAGAGPPLLLLEDHGAGFNFDCQFYSLFSLEVQGEQRLQEQGVFWEGHFGALWGEPLHWWRASGSNIEGAWPGQILLLIPWDLPLALAHRGCAAPASPAVGCHQGFPMEFHW